MKLHPIPLVLALLSAGLAQGAETPKGWFKAGSSPREYLMTLDRTVTHSGKASATIRCTAARPKGFGTLMQSFNAEMYRGKRIRFSGYVKASEAEGGGLWMRVDGPGGKVLSFDNMQRRAIVGTTNWVKHEIVLDVPEMSESVNFGLMIQSGQLWMDDLKFEQVGKDVPVTDLEIGKEAESRKPTTPTNLDFEESE